MIMKDLALFQFCGFKKKMYLAQNLFHGLQAGASLVTVTRF